MRIRIVRPLTLFTSTSGASPGAGIGDGSVPRPGRPRPNRWAFVTAGLAWMMRASWRMYATRARLAVCFASTAAGPLVDGSVDAVRLVEYLVTRPDRIV